MNPPESVLLGAYEGRGFLDPDDGSGAACFVGGARLIEVEIATGPDELAEDE